MKAKRVRITLELLLCWFMPGAMHYEVLEDEVPIDAKIVDVDLNRDHTEIELTITSDQFEEVKDGQVIPELKPILRDLREKS